MPAAPPECDDRLTDSAQPCQQWPRATHGCPCRARGICIAAGAREARRREVPALGSRDYWPFHRLSSQHASQLHDIRQAVRRTALWSSAVLMPVRCVALTRGRDAEGGGGGTGRLRSVVKEEGTTQPRTQCASEADEAPYLSMAEKPGQQRQTRGECSSAHRSLITLR